MQTTKLTVAQTAPVRLASKNHSSVALNFAAHSETSRTTEETLCALLRIGRKKLIQYRKAETERTPKVEVTQRDGFTRGRSGRLGS
jgi:hypothetical protein